MVPCPRDILAFPVAGKFSERREKIMAFMAHDGRLSAEAISKAGCIDAQVMVQSRVVGTEICWRLPPISHPAET